LDVHICDSQIAELATIAGASMYCLGIQLVLEGFAVCCIRNARNRSCPIKEQIAVPVDIDASRIATTTCGAGEQRTWLPENGNRAAWSARPMHGKNILLQRSSEDSAEVCCVSRSYLVRSCPPIGLAVKPYYAMCRRTASAVSCATLADVDIFSVHEGDENKQDDKESHREFIWGFLFKFFSR
jgi:cytochrome c5